MDNREEMKWYLERMKYGFKPQAVGWGSTGSQEKRFDVLLKLMDNEQGKVTLLDVGCGLGDLYLYIEEHQRDGFEVEYYGIDYLYEMVHKARENTKMDSRIRHLDIHDCYDRYDYVVASGIFTHKDFTYMSTAVDVMFELCKRGCAFNCLHDAYKGERREDDVFHSIRVVRDIVQATVAGTEVKVMILEDYLPNDFSVLIWRL